jgi:exonuclease VII large subunit
MTTPNKNDLMLEVAEWTAKLDRIHRHTLDNFLWQLSDLVTRLLKNSPEQYLLHQVEILSDVSNAFRKSILHSLDIRSLHLKDLNGRLTALSPQATLNRGFALVTNQINNHLVTSTKEVSHQLPISIQVSDGTFDASVVKE